MSALAVARDFVLESGPYSLDFPFSFKIDKRDGQCTITRFD